MAQLPNTDPFSLRNFDFTDLRDESKAVRQGFADLALEALHWWTPEMLCREPMNLEAGLDRQAAELTTRKIWGSAATPYFESFKAMHQARIHRDELPNDYDDLNWVIRRGGTIIGGWHWYGIEQLGTNPLRVSAYPFPLARHVRGPQLGEWIAKFWWGLLKKRTYTFNSGNTTAILDAINARMYYETPFRSVQDRIMERIVRDILADPRLDVTVTPDARWDGMNLYTIRLA